jgi:hypothetical protein
MTYFPSLSRQTWPHDPHELDAVYDDPRGLSGANPAWEAANLVTFTFPWRVKSGGQSGRIHKKAKPSLDRVLGAIWDYVGHDQTKIDAAHLSEFGGSYVFRANRNNPAALSNHARGIAIDLAPEENPNRAPWVDDGKHLPRFVIEAFKQEGWRWGGDFSGTKDAMHFEAVFDQHHDQAPVPAPIPPPQGEGGAAPAAPGGGLAALGRAPPSILDLGDELAGLLLRKLVVDRTGLPAEVDRFKATQLATLLVARAQIDAAIAALQGFTLTPLAPAALAPGRHALLPLPDIAGLLPPAQTAATHAAAAAPAGPAQRSIVATVFGGAADPNESAYDGHAITDHEEGCALPFRFAGSRPLVAITGPKGAATVPIIDVGPIYPSKRGPADPYWQTGARPRAETDRVLSQAGIDLTPRTARDVGIDGKGKVDWSFATGNEPAMSATGEMQMPLDQTNSPPNIPAFLINWKTSAAGAIPILLACVDILQQLTSGHFDQTHLYADLGAIAAGFGLVGAQDSKK